MYQQIGAYDENVKHRYQDCELFVLEERDTVSMTIMNTMEHQPERAYERP